MTDELVVGKIELGAESYNKVLLAELAWQYVVIEELRKKIAELTKEPEDASG